MAPLPGAARAIHRHAFAKKGADMPIVASANSRSDLEGESRRRCVSVGVSDHRFSGEYPQSQVNASCLSIEIDVSKLSSCSEMSRNAFPKSGKSPTIADMGKAGAYFGPSPTLAHHGSGVIFCCAAHQPLVCNPPGARLWLPKIRSYHNHFCFQRVAGPVPFKLFLRFCAAGLL